MFSDKTLNDSFDYAICFLRGRYSSNQVISLRVEDDKKDFRVYYFNKTKMKLQHQLLMEVECSLINVNHTNY